MSVENPVAALTGPLYLASSECVALSTWLERHRQPGPVVVIPWASEGLDDCASIVDPVLDAIAALGIEPRVLGAQDPRNVLTEAGAVVIPGGDPFQLLRRCRTSGVAGLLSARHAGGLPIAGQSAGAMICGPTLEPIRLTSPFTPAPDQMLDGLRLTSLLVLPHHDRPGRAARHRAAARTHAGSVVLMPLWDGEVLEEVTGAWRITQAGLTTRVARIADAPALATVFRAAATAAWTPFIGAARLAGAPDDTNRWLARIEAAGDRLLVAENATGVLGFVLYGDVPDDDRAAGSVGEVDLLYTAPRAWGQGIGRRLLERATFALLAQGFREAVLWTEQRNMRALAVYRRNGWTLDGAVRERNYLGASIRELRHRLDLTACAGGVDR